MSLLPGITEVHGTTLVQHGSATNFLAFRQGSFVCSSTALFTTGRTLTEFKEQVLGITHDPQNQVQTQVEQRRQWRTCVKRTVHSSHLDMVDMAPGRRNRSTLSEAFAFFQSTRERS